MTWMGGLKPPARVMAEKTPPLRKISCNLGLTIRQEPV